MSTHPFLTLGPILAQIAEHLSDEVDHNAFVRSSRFAQYFANSVLYRYIELIPRMGALFAERGQRKSALLLRTVQLNARIASSVVFLEIEIFPTIVTNLIISACPSLRSLRWVISHDVLVAASGRTWTIASPLVPPSVRNLAIVQYSEWFNWFPEWTQSLTSAADIRTLWLNTTLENVCQILGALSSKIRKLRVATLDFSPSVVGSHPSPFLSMQNLHHLRVDSPGLGFLKFELPASLQHLELRTLTLRTIEAICHRLCDPTWLPSLKCLPTILAITRRHLENPEDMEEKILATCQRAKRACMQRVAWVGKPHEFDKLIEKVSAECNAIARFTRLLN